MINKLPLEKTYLKQFESASPTLQASLEEDLHEINEITTDFKNFAQTQEKKMRLMETYERLRLSNIVYRDLITITQSVERLKTPSKKTKEEIKEIEKFLGQEIFYILYIVRLQRSILFLEDKIKKLPSSSIRINIKSSEENTQEINEILSKFVQNTKTNSNENIDIFITQEIQYYHKARQFLHHYSNAQTCYIELKKLESDVFLDNLYLFTSPPLEGGPDENLLPSQACLIQREIYCKNLITSLIRRNSDLKKFYEELLTDQQNLVSTSFRFFTPSLPTEKTLSPFSMCIDEIFSDEIFSDEIFSGEKIDSFFIFR